MLLKVLKKTCLSYCLYTTIRLKINHFWQVMSCVHQLFHSFHSGHQQIWHKYDQICMTTFVRRKKPCWRKNKLLVWFVRSWRLFNNGIGISVNSIELIYILLKVCERFSYYRSTLLYMANCIYEQHIYSWSLVFSDHLLLRLHLLNITYTFHTFDWSKLDKENGNEFLFLLIL